jgi:hypothetical protein
VKEKASNLILKGVLLCSVEYLDLDIQLPFSFWILDVAPAEPARRGKGWQQVILTIWLSKEYAKRKIAGKDNAGRIPSQTRA